jgi:hypothetical protein
MIHLHAKMGSLTACRISKKLSESKYRFLYELIQNADELQYERLEGNGVSPFLRFEFTPDAFIVETNEDGFRRENVEAICATGKSSKNARKADNCIGEKGFGFKSVFAIANEVHIQSRLWSFCFSHRDKEDGLGMVTPLDAAPECLPEGVTTRMTMRYSKEAKKEYSRLLEAVKELPDTMILFLRSLRTIHINITDLDSQQDKTTFTKSYDTPETCCTVTRLRESKGIQMSDVRKYLLFHTLQTNMPLDERRTPGKDLDITLAFPIDTTTQQPHLCDQGQYVSAFYPVQRMRQIQVRILFPLYSCD